MARRRRRSSSASRRSRRSRRRSAPSRRRRTASPPRPCGRAPGSSTAPSSSGASPSTSTPDGGSSARGRHAEGPLAPPRAPCARGRPLPDRGLLGVRLRDPVPPAAGDRRAAVPGLRAPARACPDRVGLRVPRVRPLPAEPPRLASLRVVRRRQGLHARRDRKSTRLNSSHGYISYAVFCLKKKKNKNRNTRPRLIVTVPSGGAMTAMRRVQSKMLQGALDVNYCEGVFGLSELLVSRRQLSVYLISVTLLIYFVTPPPQFFELLVSTPVRHPYFISYCVVVL